MPKVYPHLTTQERAVVMTMRDDQCSIRAIAKRLGRAPSSISRELRRAPGGIAYDANLAPFAERRPSRCATALAKAVPR